MEIQDERKCVKRLFGEDQLSFASSTKVLHVLGKQPQWLQTSTHEVLLPSSNSPAPLLSLLTLLFFSLHLSSLDGALYAGLLVVHPCCV